MGQPPALVVDDLELDAPDRVPLLLLDPMALLRPAAASLAALSEQTEPTGLISVMPQPCSTWTPCSSSKASIIDGGAAAPPTTARSSVDSFLPVSLR